MCNLVPNDVEITDDNDYGEDGELFVANDPNADPLVKSLMVEATDEDLPERI